MDNLLLFWDMAWVPLLIGMTLILWSIHAGRSKGRKRCPKCRYDMSHASPPGAEGVWRCPECGWATGKEERLLGIHPRWRNFVAGALLTIFSLLWMSYPRFQRGGWNAFIPDTVLILSMSKDIDSWAARVLHDRLKSRGDKFNADRMWNWQWRLMAKLAGDSVRAGDDQWFESDQMQLLLGAPSPHDVKALPYIEDALQRKSGLNVFQLLWTMQKIAESSGSHEVRMRFMEVVISLVPSDTTQNVPPGFLAMLGQPWPEAGQAVPAIHGFLGTPQQPWDQNRWGVLHALIRMGSFGREAVDAVSALLESCDPATNQRIVTLEAMAHIAPDDPRLRRELLRDIGHEWPPNRLAEMERSWDEPDYALASHQIAAMRWWLDLEFEPQVVLPRLREYLQADDFYYRFFDDSFDTIASQGDEDVRLLMHVIETSPVTKSEGGVLNEAHDALRRLDSLPEDVIVRLRTEAESPVSSRRKLASQTLRQFEHEHER